MDTAAEPLTFAKSLQFTSDWLWGMPLLYLLIGGGLFFTVYSRFVPFLYMRHTLQILRGKFSDPNDPGELTNRPASVVAGRAIMAAMDSLDMSDTSVSELHSRYPVDNLETFMVRRGSQARDDVEEEA